MNLKTPPYPPPQSGGLVLSHRQPALNAAVAGNPTSRETAPFTLVVDSREQAPLLFQDCEAVRGTLHSGDYSVVGLEEQFSIERKSIDDLVGCCMGDNRKRFERELHRLRGFRFARLLIVGSRQDVEQGRYRSQITPKAVLATVAAFEARYVPVVWAANEIEAAALVHQWAYYFVREFDRTLARRGKSND